MSRGTYIVPAPTPDSTDQDSHDVLGEIEMGNCGQKIAHTSQTETVQSRFLCLKSEYVGVGPATLELTLDLAFEDLEVSLVALDE